MNKLILLFGVLIFLVAVNARHYVDKNEQDSSDVEETLRPKEHVSHHRRRRWQSNYGYDYPPPSYYYPDRRDDRNNQEVIQHVYRLLEEISAYLRRTPPPAPQLQPIYIPYPVVYPSQVACKNEPKPLLNSSNPTPTKRFPDMEDTNQNWGIVAPAPAQEEEDDYSDGARPISFEPLVPKQLMKRPSPNVEHGSKQLTITNDELKFENEPSPAAVASSQSRISVPGMCNAAILSCCGVTGSKMQQKQCFASVGCASTYDDGSACTAESIDRALNTFKAAYAPL